MSSEKVFYCDHLLCHLDFESGESMPGYFSSYLINGVVVFEWKSTDPQPMNLIEINIEHSWVFFYMHLIHSIQLTADENSPCILRFSVRQMQTYSRFIFKDQDAVAAVHSMVEQFQVQNYIIPHPQFNTIYKVQLKTDRKFVYPPESIDLIQLQCLYSQKATIAKLPQINEIYSEPLSKQEFMESFDDNGRIPCFSELKKHIYEAGLEKDARPYALPYLFGVYQPSMSKEEIAEIDELNLRQYQNIYEQSCLMTEAQNQFHPYHNVINQDVIRTDRSDPWFEKEGSPAAITLTHILKCFSLYDPDTGYTQGMGDFVVPLMRIYIKDFKENEMVMFDGNTLPANKVESLIFWYFVNMLKVSQQDRLFSNLSDCNQFYSDRIFAIAKAVHPSLTTWLTANNATELLFLHNSIMLQFKREFSLDTLLKIWDYFYSAENTSIFLRFYAAAILILTFPEASGTNTNQLGDIQQAVIQGIKKMDGVKVVYLAKQLLKVIQEEMSQNEWIFMRLPEQHEVTTSNPHYFTIHSI